jgi:hypothetical protein
MEEDSVHRNVSDCLSADRSPDLSPEGSLDFLCGSSSFDEESVLIAIIMQE